MAKAQLAVDLAGYPILESDVVFDGAKPWRVQQRNGDGTLHAVDAHAWTTETADLEPEKVVRVRPDRIDDREYMRSVWTQSLIMREFWDE